MAVPTAKLAKPQKTRWALARLRSALRLAADRLDLAWHSRAARSRSLYATPRVVNDPEACDFYHVMEIPGFGLTTGCDWDLRGREAEYLGDIELAGKRVLEIGPASGYLTVYMESQGAEVTCVELAPHLDWDVLPAAEIDMEAFVANRRAADEKLRNSFWFTHQRFSSRANVHYGNVYDLPAELGRFDVAVMCSVLLHVRDPLRVVENCARLADTLVVTDVHYDDLPDDRPLMHLFSTRESISPQVWWRLTPRLFVRFAEIMGRSNSTVTFHEQTYVADGAPRPAQFFTVVSRRSPGAA